MFAPVLLLAFSALSLAFGNEEVVQGNLCMTVEPFRLSKSDPSAFLECAQLSDEEVREYGLTGKDLGIWTLRDCPSGFEFDETKQRCAERKKLRRQQSLCSRDPWATGCHQQCNVQNGIQQVGSSCNWLDATLVADPANSQNFLQCAPATNAGCGAWVRMPCAPGTVFSPASQVCVHQSVSMQTCGGATSTPVCSCAQRPQVSSCPGTLTCQQSVCCQSVQPPAVEVQPSLCIGTGAQPVASCNYPCPGNTVCQPNIGCCPTTFNPVPQPPPTPVAPAYGVTCPDGSTAYMQCGPLSQCPQNMGCFQGHCCPMSCPYGQNPTGFCMASGCSNGGSCHQPAGCCCAAPATPPPVCPSGVLATQRCQLGGQCPNGQACENGLCCPLPICSNQQIATQTCGFGNACPLGFVCEGRGCCPEPLPLCPNGARASRKCLSGADCPAGSGCNQQGGCCPLSFDPICPMNLNPVCQCSSNEACPSGTSCYQGTCCSSTSIAVAQVPGAQCQQSGQCNGFSSGCAQCVQSVCVCVNGALSNGALCQQMAPATIQQARSGCDQKLWPGEFGCSEDAECAARCPNTYCELRTDKKVGQCQCRDGLLLHGRCFQRCPKGFHESGAFCMHDDEDAFWKDAAAQDALKQLLNRGQC
uniref:Chitin-binding type-2 domain-containing protein n=1 Tax=Steinernema glaseri TaxID=37863 RepID=A0A1I8AUG4_9BILA